MKNKKLKALLFMGVFSLSLSVTAQDKYATKFPLNGVEAVETFGMTQAEKQEYEEKRDIIEMCANETESEVSEIESSGPDTYKTGVSLKSYDRYNYRFTINGEELRKWTLVYRDQQLMENGYREFYRDILEANVEHITYNGSPIKVGPYRPDIQGDSNYYAFEIIYFKKTENYQWCVDNGYEVKK